ncbi:MAPEG family protein [Novosphingobium lentum]|uniref:MAPEG family protein n=1 Tax=Novosphingobium lentum TaxID=145287 RepID=UPI00082A4FF7|nr:MAPEG family protein [Novosphingobium lentum]
MQAQMLAPAAVLVLWSLVMLLWMVHTRFAAFGKAGIDLKVSPPGGRGQALEGVLPDQVNWKAHNFSHLMEQPTIFYPTVVILAIMGAGAIDVALAWAYVALRIVHSVWQATVNRIPVRFVLFGLSTVCLLVLAIRAVIATLFHDPSIVSA